MNIKEGDLLKIKGDKKSYGKWTIRRVTKLFKGKDHLIRVVHLKAGKSHFERDMQYFHPLELSCGMIKRDNKVIKESKETVDFRPVRKTNEEVRRRIRRQAEKEHKFPEVE